jgi:hypothetical protein
LLCTSTPTVHAPNAVGSTRELDPIPPFHPNATVPVPAPTLPSATGPSRAESSAWRTCSARTGRLRIATLSVPSFVSATTGLIERTRSIPGRASCQATSASAADHTQSVHVSSTGVSSSPSSSTCVLPSSLPKPLPTTTAAGTRSRNRSPPCGRIAVTPVRTLSPSTTVACPTRTPATSVIAFHRPGASTPGATPSARARVRPAGTTSVDAAPGAALETALGTAPGAGWARTAVGADASAATSAVPHAATRHARGSRPARGQLVAGRLQFPVRSPRVLHRSLRVGRPTCPHRGSIRVRRRCPAARAAGSGPPAAPRVGRPATGACVDGGVAKCGVAKRGVAKRGVAKRGA